MLITKLIVDASSLVFQAVVHVVLRDLTNHYWHKELQQQSQRLTETQIIKTNNEELDSVSFERKESNTNTIESTDVQSIVEGNQINEECSHESGDNSSNDEHFNIRTMQTQEECTNGNLRDCIQKEELGNCWPVPFCDTNITSNTSENEMNGNVENCLSQSPDKLKGTYLKKNLSYIIVAPESGNDSLTFKTQNNENYLGEPTCAIGASTSRGFIGEPNIVQEILIPQVETEQESLNDLTLCFRGVDSIDPSKTVISCSPVLSESTAVDEGMTELPQKFVTPEVNQFITEQNPVYNDKYTALTLNATESYIIRKGTIEPNSYEETFPKDSIWSVDIVQERIQNLLSALTSNVDENAGKVMEPVKKISATSYEDSDEDSETESYEDLVKKVLSGTTSGCCMCTTETRGPNCLQVVEFDDADELLSDEQMSSVDSGSVSDWLYSVTPAVCLPSTSLSTVETSEGPLRMRVHGKSILIKGKQSKYQDEVISRTLFTDRWVGDSKKYCMT